MAPVAAVIVAAADQSGQEDAASTKEAGGDGWFGFKMPAGGKWKHIPSIHFLKVAVCEVPDGCGRMEGFLCHNHTAPPAGQNYGSLNPGCEGCLKTAERNLFEERKCVKCKKNMAFHPAMREPAFKCRQFAATPLFEGSGQRAPLVSTDPWIEVQEISGGARWEHLQKAHFVKTATCQYCGKHYASVCHNHPNRGSPDATPDVEGCKDCSQTAPPDTPPNAPPNTPPFEVVLCGCGNLTNVRSGMPSKLCNVYSVVV